jgi:hypothetical protein
VASFVGQAQIEQLPTDGRLIGVDSRVRQIAVTVPDDHDHAHRQDGRTAAQNLAR